MHFAKSILSYLLIGSLIIATMGVTLSKHYCMGRLKDVSFFAQHNSCLPQGEDDCPPECCKDVIEKWQLADLEHQLSIITLTAPNTLILLAYPINIDVARYFLNESLDYGDSPPPSVTPIYIAHQVFRI